MIRTINEEQFLFLCQCADWQCIVEAEDEDTAATIAMENIMNDKEKRSLSAVIAIKKLQNNLFVSSMEEEVQTFFSPLILANAGFHAEALKLQEFLDKQSNGQV